MWYIQMRTAAVRTVGDLRVHLGTVDDGRRVGAGLRGTSDIGPNRAISGSVHLLVTLNSDPQSDVAQWGGVASKREGEVGGSMSVGVERDLAYGAVGGM
jgi:hypothetical protein